MNFGPFQLKVYPIEVVDFVKKEEKPCLCTADTFPNPNAKTKILKEKII